MGRSVGGRWLMGTVAAEKKGNNREADDSECHKGREAILNALAAADFCEVQGRIEGVWASCIPSLGAGKISGSLAVSGDRRRMPGGL